MAATPPDDQRTIGQLVSDATHDVQGIVRSEIALAKAEVGAGAKVMGKGAALLAVAGFLALLGLIFLIHTAVQVLAIWLPISASYGIVTAFIFLLVGVLALLGIRALKKAKPTPSRAIAGAQATFAAIKQPADR